MTTINNVWEQTKQMCASTSSETGKGLAKYPDIRKKCHTTRTTTNAIRRSNGLTVRTSNLCLVTTRKSSSVMTDLISSKMANLLFLLFSSSCEIWLWEVSDTFFPLRGDIRTTMTTPWMGFRTSLPLEFHLTICGNSFWPGWCHCPNVIYWWRVLHCHSQLQHHCCW